MQTQLEADPFYGQIFDFHGRRGDRIKLLWGDGDGSYLFCKRLDQGRFVWPQLTSGRVSLIAAHLSMLLEGIDWRRPFRTALGVKRGLTVCFGLLYRPYWKAGGPNPPS
ncbi:IS66 family insertion sequence element accessory protein TnpB [Pseudomonas syringae]|uniref:IS66 family insertion sequence element accessory protein TnpB n=1 Tax=Pseudomonas syringae TaxID=317 RepID=UPI001CA91159